jgi:pullulanase/glycogen debranching enzyme
MMLISATGTSSDSATHMPACARGKAFDVSAAMRVWPGQPYPLGATWTGLGINFTTLLSHATHEELSVFDSADTMTPSHYVRLPDGRNADRR